MTPIKWSKTPTKKPSPPDFNKALPFKHDAARYTTSNLDVNYGDLGCYLHLTYLNGHVFDPAHLNQWRAYGRRETLWVICEGTLLSDEYKQHLIATGNKFRWVDYYKSIKYESINTQHLPIIAAAKHIGYNIQLLCSTPVQYARFVLDKLEIHGLRPSFSDVQFKPRPDLNTENWMTKVIGTRATGRLSKFWILSDTFRFNRYENRAFYF